MNSSHATKLHHQQDSTATTQERCCQCGNSGRWKDSERDGLWYCESCSLATQVEQAAVVQLASHDYRQHDASMPQTLAAGDDDLPEGEMETMMRLLLGQHDSPSTAGLQDVGPSRAKTSLVNVAIGACGARELSVISATELSDMLGEEVESDLLAFYVDMACACGSDKYTVDAEVDGVLTVLTQRLLSQAPASIARFHAWAGKCPHLASQSLHE